MMVNGESVKERRRGDQGQAGAERSADGSAEAAGAWTRGLGTSVRLAQARTFES